MEVMHERVAGLDVHKAMIVACVRIMSAGKINRECRTFETSTASLEALLIRAGLPESTYAAFRVALEVSHETGYVDTVDGAARLRRRMVERVLTHCETDRQAAEPLLILLRRFATESAREEARMFCEDLVEEEISALLEDDLIAA